MFKSEIKDKFQVTGITSGAMQDAIQKWMNIYNGEPEWLDPENGIRTINFAGFICEEIARLSTLAIDVNFDGRRAKYMKDFWDTCVKDHIREWTESMCAFGTVILKPNGMGVDLITPDQMEITAIDGNRKISGIVFQDEYQSGEDYYTKLEYHRFLSARVKMPEAEKYTDTMYYVVSNRAFISKNAGELGKEIEHREQRG